MRVRASMRSMALSIVNDLASLLSSLPGRLAGLLLQDLADEAEALQLVGIGRPDTTDLRGGLAHLLLVDAGDEDLRDVLRLRARRHADRDPLRLPGPHPAREAHPAV